MPPLVSVLLVAYNAGEYLALAVESVLCQSLNNLELVLVDNATSDGSVEALKASCGDSRLRIFPQDHNRRHNGGLRAGLPHCRGQFIAIMDADDVALPDRLACQVEALQCTDTIAGIGCAAATIDSEGRITGHELTLFDRREIRCYTQFDMPFVFPTLLARREVFMDFPFHSQLPMAHDFDWLARAGEKNDFVALRKVLFHYRRNAGSTTSRSLANLFATASAVRLAHARRRAGRDENLEALLAEREKLVSRQPSEGQVFAHFARLALSEKLWLQAAWHARKAGVFWQKWEGLKLLLASIVKGRGLPSSERAELLRLALLGTVRAYRLHPQRK